MGIFDPDEVITEYSLRQAVEDGVLVEIFKNRWKEFPGGKPIVATMNVFESVSEAELWDIWNKFVYWKRHIEPGLPEERRLFSMEVDYMTIWVIEDSVAYTTIKGFEVMRMIRKRQCILVEPGVTGRSAVRR